MGSLKGDGGMKIVPESAANFAFKLERVSEKVWKSEVWRQKGDRATELREGIQRNSPTSCLT